MLKWFRLLGGGERILAVVGSVLCDSGEGDHCVPSAFTRSYFYLSELGRTAAFNTARLDSVVLFRKRWRPVENTQVMMNYRYSL